MRKFATSNAMGSQQGQQTVATIFEDCVADFLRAKNIEFKTEAEIKLERRFKSHVLTPDFLFSRPLRINTPTGATEVGWLDCKNYYGSALLANCTKIPSGKLNARAKKLSSCYGTGGFIFSQGFCKDLQQHLPTCILLDAVPVVDLSRVTAYQDSH